MIPIFFATNDDPAFIVSDVPFGNSLLKNRPLISGWSFEDVLPFFKKSEDNRDQDLAKNTRCQLFLTSVSLVTKGCQLWHFFQFAQGGVVCLFLWSYGSWYM
jgi:choline dehydrogenase-like flavoprotein